MIPLLECLHVVDDEIELAVREHGIDAAETLGCLRPRQERHDHADGERSAETEVAGRAARREAQFLDDIKYSLPGRAVDQLAAVQRPGRRGDADTGLAGDVADRYGLLRQPRPLRL